MGVAQANAVPIMFPPGRTETEIEVPIINDRLVEGTERFLGRIISGGGITDLNITAPTATVDIIDDDSKWILPPSHTHKSPLLYDWNFAPHLSLSGINCPYYLSSSLQSLSF